MGAMFGHLRYGARMLVRRPGLNATAIIALALGIGLTTTMFSIVYVAVIRGLPFEDSDELAALFRNRPAQGAEFMSVSIHDFQDWRAQQTSFEGLAAYYAETVNVGGIHFREGRRERLRYVYLSDAEAAALARLGEHGVEVTAQDVPTGRRVPLAELVT